MVYLTAFDFCNIASVKNYLNTRKLEHNNLEKKTNLKLGDLIIMPGVGSFAQGMQFLRKKCLDKKVSEFANYNGKILGICLGMQLMFNSSEESPGIEGLKIISGKCKQLPYKDNCTVPRVGWDPIYYTSKNISLNKNPKIIVDVQNHCQKPSSSDYYFVHSYFCEPTNAGCTKAWFQHGHKFYCAYATSRNIIGVQFHPEKSGAAGFLFLDAIILGHEKTNHTSNSY